MGAAGPTGRRAPTRLNRPVMSAGAKIQKKIAALAESQSGDFEVLHHRPQWRSDPARPLLIVIHPGDAIERLCDWDDKEVGRQVADLSSANQQAMAREIKEKLGTHDVIVLHRLSSAYLQQGGVEHDYRDALKKCDAVALALYGDDLPAAASWMQVHVPGIHDRDLHLFMTGAYADEESGCITAIGKSLLEFNSELDVEVSMHAPSDQSNSQSRWRPGGPMAQPVCRMTT